MGTGWGIPCSPSICWITVGGIGPKREDLDGQSTTRDCLSLTVSFDHNLVDGAGGPVTERFKELIEGGDGLIEQERSVLNERRPQPQVVWSDRVIRPPAGVWPLGHGPLGRLPICRDSCEITGSPAGGAIRVDMLRARRWSP